MRPCTAQRGESGAPSGTEERFGLPLSCPGCGVSGWVDWRSLKNGIACPKCGCEFLIGKNGQLQAKADLPHRRFRCPRCRHAGAIPATISTRGAPCPVCRLPLAPGPDQRLHAVETAAEMWRAAGQVALRPAIWQRLVDRFVTSGGRLRVAPILLGAIMLAIAGVATGMVVHALFDRSPETMARRFVEACLSGEWDHAEQFMADDPVQQAHFERWRSRHFSSILDAHRPAGDHVSIDAKQLSQSADACLLRVSMQSDFFGTRSQIQHWRRHDGRWQFDARETLREPLPGDEK